MGNLVKTISIFCVLSIVAILANEPLHSQAQPIPISVTCRKSFLQGSYVLVVQNTSNGRLHLWLQAKGKNTAFELDAGKMEEFGWAQGYRFEANNLFAIGGDGYQTLEQRMPNVELNPVKIDFSNDGGLAMSLSQSYLQERLPKHLKLPITKASSGFEISLNQMPQIILKNGSERIYSDATLQASVFSGRVRFPLAATVSFVPSYFPSSGEVAATQIKVENIDVNIPNSDIGLLPANWREQATQIINNILPGLFDKFVVYKIEKKWLKNILNAVNLRAKVIDGRLEIIIL